MQNFSTRKNALLAERYNSKTGKRRGFLSGWRALAAGLALALLAGSGIAVAAASTAEAHVGGITYDCTGVTITAYWYSAASTDPTPKHNTMTVLVDGKTTVKEFDESDKSAPTVLTVPFADSTANNHFIASIDGWDSSKWDQTLDKTSVGCAKPTVSIDVPTCTVPGQLLDLTANLGALDGSHLYSVTLATDAGGTNVGPLDLGAGFSTPNYSYKFPSVIPGHIYTVTVLDKTTKLTGTATKTWIGCPEDAGIEVSPCVCTEPSSNNGGNAEFMIKASGLSFGRSYQVDLLDATGAGTTVLKTTTIVADDSGAANINFPVAGGGTYKAIITDLTPGSTVTKTSTAVHFLPCPEMPAKPLIDPGVCTSTNGTPNSTITFSASNLVPTRSYRVTISGGVYDSTPFVATQSAWPVVTSGPASMTLPVPPGTYSVTVSDVSDPGATKYVSSDDVTIIPCPTLPEVAFTPTECTVPGGTSSVAVTVTNYVPERKYTIGLKYAVGGKEAAPTATVTAPVTGPWTLAPFTALAANTQYVITVTDTEVTSVTAAANVSLKPCPGTPTVTVDATCNVLGASTLNVTLGKLENGENYTVTVTNTATKKVVGTATTPGTQPSVALQVGNVPNGNQYTVSVANATNTLTGSGDFNLAKCDPTLAYTGANPVAPAVAGIGFLQMGLMFVGLALVKRRKRTV